MSRRDPAAARFAAIQFVRLGGTAMVLLGIAVHLGRVAALAWAPPWLGLVLIAAGLVEFFVAPLLLARRWRSPPR